MLLLSQIILRIPCQFGCNHRRKAFLAQTHSDTVLEESSQQKKIIKPAGFEIGQRRLQTVIGNRK